MKVEWKKLFFGLIFGTGLTMTACQDEITSSSGGNDRETPEPTETAYLSFRLSAGSLAHTRYAIVDETYLESEQKVNNIRMVLYETKNHTVRYAWDLDASNRGGNFGGSDVSTASGVAQPTTSRFVTTGREVIKQDYKLLILVNPPIYLIEATQPGNPVSRLNMPAVFNKDELTSPGGIAENDNFYMTNHQELIDVPEFTLQNTKEMAEQGPHFVEVERAVAKVIVTGDPHVSPDGDRIEDLKWGLDVTNRYTYWMRKMTHIANITGEATIPEEVGIGDRYERYAEDPNFSGFSRWNGGNPDYQFELLPELPELANPFGSFDYVLENTMDAFDQHHDVATRVVISGTYTPRGIGMVPTRAVPGTSFYTYKGTAISVNSMRDMANDYNLIPQELRNAGLEEAINEVLAWNPNTFTNPNQSFAHAGINFYYQGVCYYFVRIRHFTDQQVPVLMGYGRYGVVRNNVYRLTIHNIIGPGSPVVTPPEPEPLDKETGWVAADIEILPWYVRDQDVEELL
ncbi:Mfa1 family fimbria major subunit [Bacteroides sp.]